MKSRWTLHGWAMLGAAVLGFFAVSGRVWAQSGTQSGSLNAPDIQGLFSIVMVFAVLVFVLVEGLLIFAIVRYRRRSNEEMPEQIHGNNRLEIGWTIGSAVLVLILFFFTLGFYQQPRNLPVESNPLVVQITGHTWYWEYYYPETGIRLNSHSDDFRVPAGRPVVLEITSADVQHSFWVPELAGKVDAIPGRVQRMWFEVDEPRRFVGQCAEYCGREHYNMLINIDVMGDTEFTSWYDEQAAAVAAAAEAAAAQEFDSLVGDPANGEALYNSLGCVACHSLDGSTRVGPSFQGLGERAGTRIDGVSAKDYVHTSIINPCDFVVEGFTCVMPQNYGDQLSPQDLADLISFLLAQ